MTAPAPRPARPRDIFLLAAWAGMLTGLAEVALLAAAKLVLHRYLHMDAGLAWLSPVFYVLFFGVLAVPRAAGAHVAPQRPWLRIALILFGTLGVLGPLFLFHKLYKTAALVLAAGVAIVGADLIGRRPETFLRLVRLTLVPLALVVVAVRQAVKARRAMTERRAVAALPAAPPRAPNVLLIVLDAVRSMDLSLYGYQRPTTPVLERLATRSVVFDRAVASSSWTLPSHATMMTGLWADETRANWNTPLRSDVPTLAEALTARGYRTGGFVANTYYVGRESGLDRGFAHWDAEHEAPGHLVLASAIVRPFDQDLDGWRLRMRRWQTLGRKDARLINRQLLDWLHDGPADRPFFAFLNYYDAHDPYITRAPFDTMFGRRPDDFIPMLWRSRDPPPGELRDLQLAYDQGIRALDHDLGLLLDTLAARGVLDNTLVIVTSDHGEEFGEHHLIQHGYSLYMPSLRVPLLVSLPGRVPAGQRLSPWVSLRDLAATVLDVTGDSAHAIPGRSLARFWTGADTVSDTLHTELRHAGGLPARFPVSQGDLTSAIAGDGYHFIVTGRTGRELFNAVSDSMELKDLLPDSAYRVRGEALQSWLARHAPNR